MSDSATFNRAARVIDHIGPDRPADAALREYLAEHRRISPAEKRDVSRAVFSYHRWYQWLDLRASFQTQLAAAVYLQDRFDRDVTLVKTQALAARAIPDWITDEVEFTPEDLRALQTPPVLWLRARRADAAHVSQKLAAPAPDPTRPCALIYPGQRDLYQVPEFQAGQFEIQDLGSQLVGEACAAQPGETWWDACAGEGGKTLHLVDQMENKGMIWATDRNARRLRKLKQRLARAEAFNTRIESWDGSAQLPTKTKFDGILLDAPCSGVGTWRRNPHARWTTTPTDVAELAAIQLSLLTNVADSLKPGGRLIYAVCTITKSETTAVADAFTAAHPKLEPLSLLDRGPQTFLPLAEFNANAMFLAGWKMPEA
jgi:16S rRNA (cytosine967-C5)-methyltransferase